MSKSKKKTAYDLLGELPRYGIRTKADLREAIANTTTAADVASSKARRETKLNLKKLFLQILMVCERG